MKHKENRKKEEKKRKKKKSLRKTHREMAVKRRKTDFKPEKGKKVLGLRKRQVTTPGNNRLYSFIFTVPEKKTVFLKSVFVRLSVNPSNPHLE